MELVVPLGLSAASLPALADGGRVGRGGIPPVVVACEDHLHVWRGLPDSVGLFTSTHGDCRWFAVYPACLGSLDVALRVRDGLVGMALYWCPAHQGGGAHDG